MISPQESIEKVWKKPENDPTLTMNADLDIDALKQIIGKDGYYFKLTTANSEIDYIWYNEEKKIIEFWGNKTNCEKAFKIIETRLQKFIDPNLCIPTNLSEEKNKIFIGKGGCYLKNISTENKCKIWFDKETNSIQLWGAESNVKEAGECLKKRLNYVSDLE